MTTCRECRWYKTDVGNPMKGLCISERYEADEKETAAGTATSVIPAKMVNMGDEACEKFETKPSRAQRLKEGM